MSKTSAKQRSEQLKLWLEWREKPSNKVFRPKRTFNDDAPKWQKKRVS
jgi:hypothetical protein